MRIDELRSTLAGHAEEAGPGDPVGRVGSVRSRIAAARRRRRRTVMAGVVAALALAGAGAVPLLQSDRTPDPVDRRDAAPERLAGMPVPDLVTAAGFTYRYATGVESAPGDRELSHTVPRSGETHLVMWTSSHEDDKPSLRLRAAGAATEASAPQGFERYTLLSEDTDHPLELSQQGAPEGTVLAMAIYELAADQPPPGVTSGETTFRATVLARKLVGAQIGEPGESKVSLTVTVPAGGLWLSESCSRSTDTDLFADVSVNGRPELASGCSGDVDPDPGASARRLSGPGVRAGREVEVRIRLVGPDAKQPAQDPGAVLGVAVYGGAAPTVPLAGWDVPEAVEYDGHAWAHDGFTYESEPGSRTMRVTGRAGKLPVLFTTAVDGAGDTPVSVRTLLSGVAKGHTELGGVPGFLGHEFVVQPGTRFDVEVRANRTIPGLRMGVLSYTLVQ